MVLSTDINARCEALRKDMTLRKVFELSCENADRIAAHWLEGNEE